MRIFLKIFFGQFEEIKIGGDMSNACQGKRIKISSFSIPVPASINKSIW